MMWPLIVNQVRRGKAIALLSLVLTFTFTFTFTFAMASAHGVALTSPDEVTSSDSISDSIPGWIYDYHTPSRDGIGKVYMGREIAAVMGHRGAFWLERPNREQEEQPQRMIETLDLVPNQVIADIGAGTGYMTFRLAAAVPDATILAVDIQPEMLDVVEFLKAENGVTNVEIVLAEPDDPHLPKGVDLVLMVDAYHEFEYPYEVMTAIVEALNPGGQVVLAEYRGENPLIAIKRLHKMTQRQVRRELQAVGLEWVKTDAVLPRQHLMVFMKPSP